MNLNLISAHQQALAVRAIPPEAAARNGLQTASSRAVAVSLHGPETQFIAHGDAIAIPYRGLDGEAVIGDDGVPYVRYRVFDTRDPRTLAEGNAKPQRYLARPG